MSGRNTSVFGIYRSSDDAERAVDALLGAGFSSEDISVLLPDSPSSRAFAHQKDTKAPEGAAAGVTAGGVIGGTLGVLAGVGALAIPGIGPFIAAGPIVAGLAGLGVGGAVGGFLGALIGMGMPEYEAKRYEGRVRDGGTLLSVHCDTAKRVRAAKQLLRETEAQDIGAAGESAAADPLDRRGTVDPRFAPEVRDPRYASPGRDSFVGDPSEPADPSHPRIPR
jgi:hypothetical protein